MLARFLPSRVKGATSNGIAYIKRLDTYYRSHPWRLAGPVVSIVVILLGLPGMIDDSAEWVIWLGDLWDFIAPAGRRFGLPLLGLMGIAAAVAAPILFSDKPEDDQPLQVIAKRRLPLNLIVTPHVITDGEVDHAYLKMDNSDGPGAEYGLQVQVLRGPGFDSPSYYIPLDGQQWQSVPHGEVKSIYVVDITREDKPEPPSISSFAGPSPSHSDYLKSLAPLIGPPEKQVRLSFREVGNSPTWERVVTNLPAELAMTIAVIPREESLGEPTSDRFTLRVSQYSTQFMPESK